MAKRKQDEVIGVITPHQGRRILGAGLIGVLGVILLSVAVRFPPVDIPWLIFLIVLGIGCIVLSWKLWEATATTIELTRLELREAGGRIICTLDNIESVDRGFFAYKPSNGFLVRLHAPVGRVYAPGLWWRAGRRVMVGGVTSGSQAKSVADLITILLVEREAAAGR
jgi:hypothetical protein